MGTIFEPFVYVISLLVSLYFKVVIVEVVLHWLIHFKILEPTNKYAKKTLELLEMATKPVYDKIRAKVPTVSGFDFSPFILLLALMFISRFLMRLSEILI